MRRTRILLALLAAFAAVLPGGVAFAQEVHYNYDQEADFAKYKTYKWVAIEGADQPDQLTDKNIKAAIDKQLATKGLTPSDAETVDLWIGYQVAVQQDKQLYSTGYGGWGWRYGGGMSTTTVSTINVGTLVLDIYDPAVKQLVWRGDATKTLNPSKDPQKNLEKLDKAMAKLLKNYPPPSKKK